MSVVTEAPALEVSEQHLDLFGIGWDQYVAINDALLDRSGLRMIYLEGSLSFLTLSQTHDWFADYLDAIIKAVAFGCGIEIDVAGSATLRVEDLKAGLEGDRTYYFGPNAEAMNGPRNIDLTVQPPPDLAIEVEVSHSANQAMLVYAKIGVPEVWRLDVPRGTLAFSVLSDDGTYQTRKISRNLPHLTPDDVLAQLKLAEASGSLFRWTVQLNEWVRTTILPRAIEG
jgi:Uma2 family endonuclease